MDNYSQRKCKYSNCIPILKVHNEYIFVIRILGSIFHTIIIYINLLENLYNLLENFFTFYFCLSFLYE